MSPLAVQVAVCTPGRMIDLIKMKACTMRRATFLVFDEADRMFDMGFEPQVQHAPLHTTSVLCTTTGLTYNTYRRASDLMYTMHHH